MLSRRAPAAYADAKSLLDACAAQLSVAPAKIVDLRSGRALGVEARTEGFEALGFRDERALFDAAARLNALDELEISRMQHALDAAPAERDRMVFVSLDSRAARRDAGYLDRLKWAAERAGRAPHTVCLALTERHAKSDHATIGRELQDLFNSEFRVAINGFGAGFADFATLYGFHLDFVKLDPFFISGLEGDPRKRFLAGKLIELCRHLGLQVVADGVATAGELEICRKLGCDLGAGPLIDASADAALQPETTPRASDAALADHALFADACAVEALNVGDALIKVAKRFQTNADPVLPVVGDAGEALGVVREAELKELLYSPFGLDLLKNPNAALTVRRYLRPAPRADVGADVEGLIQLIADDPSQGDGVLLTENGRYRGYLGASAVVRLSAERQRAAAEDSNPLTKLPGNARVERFVDGARRDGASTRALCHLDFDNFKPFNDTYGFRLGDRALIMFADLMRKRLGGLFLGHIGGDDFFVAACDAPIDDFKARIEELVRQFAADVASLYNSADRERGCIVARSRSGEERRFPLLACTASLLVLPAGVTVADADALSVMFADLKREAKASDDAVTLLVVDPAEAEGAAR